MNIDDTDSSTDAIELDDYDELDFLAFVDCLEYDLAEENAHGGESGM